MASGIWHMGYQRGVVGYGGCAGRRRLPQSKHWEASGVQGSGRRVQRVQAGGGGGFEISGFGIAGFEISESEMRGFEISRFEISGFEISEFKASGFETWGAAEVFDGAGGCEIKDSDWRRRADLKPKRLSARSRKLSRSALLKSRLWSRRLSSAALDWAAVSRYCWSWSMARLRRARELATRTYLSESVLRLSLSWARSRRSSQMPVTATWRPASGRWRGSAASRSVTASWRAQIWLRQS